MAVDLEDLVEPLRREINPPGQELFPDATDLILVGYLSDAFWLAKLDSFFDGYTENDGLVTPESGDTDLSRTWQQLIVFYAGMKILEMKILNTNTSFRAQAGPVEYETNNSATLLRDHLRALYVRRDQILANLSQQYTITPSYIDSVTARTNSLASGDVLFDTGITF